MQTIILSGSIHETYAWADAQGRHRRTVRHVPHAGSIQGRAYDGIVELPSFASRRDRYAVMTQLRKLRRQMPKLPYELDEDWVMPERPKKVERKHIEPEVFLFSNTPEAGQPQEMPEEIADLTAADVYRVTIEADASQAIQVLEEAQAVEQKPLGDLWFEAVEMDADEDFSAEDDTPAEITEIDQVADELGQVADELTQLGQEMEAETAATAERPKRRGRRTNEQKAYDEALAKSEADPNSERLAMEFAVAERALQARHPDDERLAKRRAEAEEIVANLPKLKTNELDF